jgi:hypothetical protein
MYWIFYSPDHALLLKDEHDEPEPCIASPERCGSMLTQAVARLAAQGLSAVPLRCMTYFTDGELQEADDPSDLYLPAHAVIGAALRQGGTDHPEITTDPDAVVSGWNVQCWQWVRPESVAHWMLQAGPIPRYRPLPDREQAMQHRHQASLDTIAHHLRSLANPEQALELFVVLCQQDEVVLQFDCQAQDTQHANEQALNAYPQARILATVPLPPSSRDALFRALAQSGDQGAMSELRPLDDAPP